MVILKIASFIFLAPLIGMGIAMALATLTLNLFRNTQPNHAQQWFKRMKLISSALFCTGHGLNDSQKVMGIIAAALFASGEIADITPIPTWVPFSCFTVIALGTMSGGWRIVKTMGSRITKITTMEGVVADTAGAITLYITEFLHIPVSTTHTITGAIMGVGAIKRLSAVRWGVTKDLLVAWILTIPVSAVMAMICYYIIQMF